MSEGKVGARSFVGAELSSKEKEKKKTGVLASSEEDCNITPFLHSSPRLDLGPFCMIR